MKKLVIAILIILFTPIMVLSQNSDTLTIQTLNSLFEYNFSNYLNRDSIDLTNLSFKMSTEVRGVTLNVNNQFIKPQFHGYAYSSKQITPEVYWFITYSEGEVAFNFWIIAINIVTGQTSELRRISYFGGDEGYWHYKSGYFDNNYVYSYNQVNGDQSGTTDSIASFTQYDAMLNIIDE